MSVGVCYFGLQLEWFTLWWWATSSQATWNGNDFFPLAAGWVYFMQGFQNLFPGPLYFDRGAEEDAEHAASLLWSWLWSLDYILWAETEEAIRSVRLCHWFLIDLLDKRSHFHASSPPALHKMQHEMSPFNWDALFYLGWEIHLNLFNLSCLDMGIILVVFYGRPVHFTSCKSSL